MREKVRLRCAATGSARSASPTLATRGSEFRHLPGRGRRHALRWPVAVRDGNFTRGCGYPRVPDPMGEGMGTKFYPRVRVWV